MPDQPLTAQSACPFCEIVTDDPHGQVEMRINGCVVITPLNPVTEGHKLVIPYSHVSDAAEYSFRTAQTMGAVADYLKHAKVGDCNIITSIGKAATQTVRHLHVHVVPRRQGDGLALPWTGQEVRDAA